MKLHKAFLVLSQIILLIVVTDSKDFVGKLDVLDHDLTHTTPKTDDRSLLDAGEITDEDLIEEDRKTDEAPYTSEEIEQSVQMTSADGDEFGMEDVGLENDMGNQNGQEYDPNMDQGQDQGGFYGDYDPEEDGNYGDDENAGNMRDEL